MGRNADPHAPIRIAIAAVRLEHVKRGVETWARDTFEALVRRGADVTLYKGSGSGDSPRECVLPSLKQHSRLSKWLIRIRPGFCWRFGLGGGDALEETTFAFSMLRQARRHGFDIIHLQDAHAANILRAAAARGWIRAKVILGHGTEEPPGFLDRFPFLQHLAPHHLDEALAALSVEASSRPSWYAVPNFVDTDVFRPVRGDAEFQECRVRLGIPPDAFVILSVAAIKKGHKRIDYLIREAASMPDPRVHLVVAGAHEAETGELMRMADSMMGSRAHVLCDLGHDQMANVFRVADVFALCSLKEMMPIALLEAIASGLPAFTHAYPVLQWMIGAGGLSLDMTVPGALAESVSELMRDAPRRNAMGLAAREHAVTLFSKDAVVDRILEMYREVAVT